MLVVIAIIALLAALLVPAVSKAQTKAARTRCMQNLRSIYQAGLGWSAEHEGRIVPAHVDDHPKWGRKFWPYFVKPYLGDQVVRCPRTVPDDHNYWCWGYGMNIHVKTIYEGKKGKPASFKNNETYDEQDDELKRTGGEKNMYFDEILSPADTLWILDYEEWQFDRYLHFDSKLPRFPASRHGNGERVCSVNYDGSTHFVNFDESLLAGGYEL